MKLPSGPREKNYSMNAKVVLSVALLCAVSCVKNEVSVTPLYNDNQIHFSPAPVRAHGTKADNSGKFSETNTFGSCAWYLPEGESWATDAKDGIGYINPVEISYKGRYWKVWGNGTAEKPEKSYYWPETGSLTFYSWSPYGMLKGSNSDGHCPDSRKLLTVSKEKGIEIANWPMENRAGYGSGADTCVDILLAQTTDCTKATSNGSVPVRFEHKLCQVEVLATLAVPLKTGESKWKVTKVTLDNIYTKGSFVTNKWTSHSEAKSYVYTPTGGVEVGYGFKSQVFPLTTMMPQYLTKDARVEKPKITIECTNGNGESKILSAYLHNDKISTSLSVWTHGKKITYQITLGEEDTFIEFGASAGDWGHGADGDINVGIR